MMLKGAEVLCKWCIAGLKWNNQRLSDFSNFKSCTRVNDNIDRKQTTEKIRAWVLSVE